jgi:hypothetical protein
MWNAWVANRYYAQSQHWSSRFTVHGSQLAIEGLQLKVSPEAASARQIT